MVLVHKPCISPAIFLKVQIRSCKMKRPPEDKQREHRIDMEIIVDCYNETERAMGWYYYIADNLKFPFKARCTQRKSTSPLKIGETVEVIGMAKDGDCMNDMFVIVKWAGQKLAVPLIQLEAIKPTRKAREAIDDWAYWVNRGYEL